MYLGYRNGYPDFLHANSDDSTVHMGKLICLFGLIFIALADFIDWNID